MTDTQEFGYKNNSYEAIGGHEGISQLVRRFYEYMDDLPEAKTIRDQHPKQLEESIEKLTFFLSGWLGGPKLYQQKYGHISIPGSHAHLPIGEPEKNAWLNCMKKSIDDQNFSEEFSDYLMKQLTIPANRIVMTSKPSIHES